MNSFLKKTEQYINNLDTKSFLKYIYIILGIVILSSSFLVYRYFSKTSQLREEWNSINKYRKEAQIIFEKDNLVKKQKDAVNEILNNGKNFKIVQYVDLVLNNPKIGLKNNKSDIKGPIISNLASMRNQDYIETKLEITLKDLNTKQLVNFLNEIEKNDRIYSKSLEIVTNKKTKTINATISIGTVQLKPETSEDKA